MRLTILGGGGFRVPLIYSALLADHGPSRIDELRLYDVAAGRLTAIAEVLREMSRGTTDAPAVRICTDLREALDGTDFIFSAIRVGGLSGRARDESIAIEHGVVGQETVGAGGISYALRTIPVATGIARAIKEFSPHAWTINFTNPAGMVTEAMRDYLGDRVIGICDSPVGLIRRVLDTMGVSDEPESIDYVGLNHLGWLRGLTVGGRNIVDELVRSPDRIASFEEGKIIGTEWIEAFGAVPNEYLHYYYNTREALQSDSDSPTTRGQFLEAQQTGFYREFSAPPDPDRSALQSWQAMRLEREQTYMLSNRRTVGMPERDPKDLEGGGYDRIALALMRAILRDETTTLILNVPNKGAFKELNDDAVVEIPCAVDGRGAHPVPAGPLPGYASGLVATVKYCEQSAIEAARTSSRSAALRAFAAHPLVDSVKVAADLLADYCAAFAELDYLR